jgi:hypothetical protein
MNVTLKHLYCDLDGVLVDFNAGFKKHFDFLPNEFETKYGTQEFWNKINQKGIKFWEKLPLMSDMKILWDYISPHNVTLLTSPSKDQSSLIGKHKWVKKNLKPEPKMLFRFTHKKHEILISLPQENRINNIIIDDREDVVKNWIKYGGIAILHTSAQQTINELKTIGI